MSKILEPFGLKFDMSKEFIAHNLSKIGLTLSNLGGQRKILVECENFRSENNVVSLESHDKGHTCTQIFDVYKNFIWL